MSAGSFALPARMVPPVGDLLAGAMGAVSTAATTFVTTVVSAVAISAAAARSAVASRLASAQLAHQGKQGRLAKRGYPCAGNRQPNVFDAGFAATFGIIPENCTEGDVQGEGWYPSHATDAAEAVAEVTVS